MFISTARVALLALAVSTAQHAFAVQQVDLSPDRVRIHVPRNEAAIAQIPPGFKFAQPGKFTVAVSGVAGPPWRCWPATTRPPSAAKPTPRSWLPIAWACNSMWCRPVGRTGPWGSVRASTTR